MTFLSPKHNSSKATGKYAPPNGENKATKRKPRDPTHLEAEGNFQGERKGRAGATVARRLGARSVGCRGRMAGARRGAARKKGKGTEFLTSLTVWKAVLRDSRTTYGKMKESSK